ncbi:hypothetical protein [Cerasicoccus frondis]|uniref:hypothetical protein n=1 Tax=Cerasicoccus frondis TaxID=490090 RepID=UPI0028525A19|nr:hypothetical protein [Cerasicoccus frondis]
MKINYYFSATIVSLCFLITGCQNSDFQLMNSNPVPGMSDKKTNVEPMEPIPTGKALNVISAEITNAFLWLETQRRENPEKLALQGLTPFPGTLILARQNANTDNLGGGIKGSAFIGGNDVGVITPNVGISGASTAGQGTVINLSYKPIKYPADKPLPQYIPTGGFLEETIINEFREFAEADSGDRPSIGLTTKTLQKIISFTYTKKVDAGLGFEWSPGNDLKTAGTSPALGYANTDALTDTLDLLVSFTEPSIVEQKRLYETKADPASGKIVTLERVYTDELAEILGLKVGDDDAPVTKGVTDQTPVDISIPSGPIRIEREVTF